jgi:hypothetical protein
MLKNQHCLLFGGPTLCFFWSVEYGSWDSTISHANGAKILQLIERTMLQCASQELVAWVH